MLTSSTHSSVHAPQSADSSVTERGALMRAGLFAYALTAYAIGMGGLVTLILACLDILPFTGQFLGISPDLRTQAATVLFNLSWILLFAVQHVIMARPAFKQAWRRVLPQATERPTFVLLAGAILGLAVLFWQPIEGQVWSLSSPVAQWTVRGVAVAGWLYLVLASFAINHFELFGLQQAWQSFQGRSISAVPFARRWMYGFDRHPIMTGVLIGLWATPAMGFDRLLLAAGFTAYIVVGVAIEERDLIRAHGETYRDYIREVPSVVPRLGRAV